MSDEPGGISDVEIQQLRDRLAKDSRSVGPKTVLAILERTAAAEACARYAADTDPEYSRNPLWVIWDKTRVK